MDKKSIGIILTIFLAILFGSCASERTGAINEKIRHDDFMYTVTDITKGSLIKEGSNIFKARGNFYIIKLKVTNEAKRVEHKWNNNTIYIVDANGKEYENDSEVQKVYYRTNFLEYKDEYVIPHGISGETIFIFDLPVDIKEPYLKFRGEFLMGDLFDRGQFTKTKIKIF
ncbi:MAG TPA: hypothetical protein VGK25_12085 [Ignavibacteria bacterium]|jgi:hypothetical protein